MAGLDGTLTPVTGTPRHAVPDHRALVAQRPRAAAGVLPGPADDAGADRVRGRQDGDDLRGHRPALGRRGPGHAGLDRRRPAGPGDRQGRRVPADDRRRAGHPGHAERAPTSWTSARTCCSPPRARTRPSCTLYTGGPDGVVQLSQEPGIHLADRNGDVLVTSSRSLELVRRRVQIRRGGEQTGEIESLAETPVLTPEVTFFTAGPHQLRCALLLPRGHQPGSVRLPVLCDPYGGPAAQRVVSARSAYLTSQWFADQGFAVLIADGRGTPGRGPDWDRLVYLRRGHAEPRGPGRGAAGGGRGLPRPRPVPGRHPRLVARRLPGRARGAAQARRLPRRGGRGASDRHAPVRHLLQRALPGPPGRAPRGVRRTTRCSRTPRTWSAR